ncbi:MAG: S-layer homology domain-containing protein, partial [Oscillospiraceae bacterium]|jgi:uncharacterized protein YkwD|nr:S-layer homology domain-containing protein [Oscillospiraceae bacterium]
LTLPAVSPFLDVNSAAVSKAYAYGIVNGISATQFAPNDKVTRQEAAAMLVRAATSLEGETGLTLLDRPVRATLPFSDRGQVVSWALDPVWLASQNGLVRGYEDNTFRPDKTITGEECVLMAYRLFKQMTERRGSAGPGTPSDPGPGVTSDQLAQYAAQVGSLVNQERAKAGMAPYNLANASLNAAADLRAQEITGYFSHTRPNGAFFADVLYDFGLYFSNAGENIKGGGQTPGDAVTSWMNSADHRSNILSAAFTDMGVGVSRDGAGVLFWELLFFTPR